MRNSRDLGGVIEGKDGNVIYVNFGIKTKDKLSNVFRTVTDLEGMDELLEGDTRPSLETIQQSTLPFKNWFQYFIDMEEIIDDERNKAAFMKLWETAKTLDNYCTLYRLLFDSGYMEIFERRIHAEFDIPVHLVQNKIEEGIIKKNNKTAEHWIKEYKSYKDFFPHYAYFSYRMLINMIDVKDANYMIDLPHDLKIK